MNDEPEDGIRFKPVTPGRWKDFETLFGSKGACGGCWCMTWRLRRGDWLRGKTSGNKKAMKRLILHGKPPGILAYAGGRAIGWCSIAPREDFVFLERSRVLARIDDARVWSISCLFIEKHFRRQGLSSMLLRAAVNYAKKKGAVIVEGYPTLPYSPNMPAPFAWTGTLSAFKKAGFEEAARRSKARPIMRVYLR